MTQTVQPGSAVVHTANLSLEFSTDDGPVHALSNINLDIAPGEFISLIGPSGCGKTTLLRVIADLETHTGGEIQVNGVSPREARESRAYGMVPCQEAAWKSILSQVEDTGADGLELNFGCPHGMSERGMGAAVGQVPDYVEMVTAWCKEYSRLPVIVKLTPNVTNIRQPAQAAKKGGADAVSLINTINSVMSVDLDSLSINPTIDAMGTHGGYCGPAVKPIALHMVSDLGRDPECEDLPISAIGGISNWRDAAEFLLLGAGNVQVCTAAMTHGFKIVDDMIDGLSRFMQEKGFASVSDLVGQAIPSLTDWQHLNLNYTVKAQIDQDLCIKCGRCHIVCEDTSHQAIYARHNGERRYEVNEEECVGCNLCVTVCPVENCLTLRKLENEVDVRTGQMVSPAEKLQWTRHPNNPMANADP
ncbi:MAG TPA: NAD-dependent dihydropyrimidine dehydrogenase subunit PreA [Gammaproteobacteria bacterium]|nr:NAD-dependent dihydropyrimidine dehydrogenase subunit PreA [Gammaproteobacteria bacterium]